MNRLQLRVPKQYIDTLRILAKRSNRSMTGWILAKIRESALAELHFDLADIESE